MSQGANVRSVDAIRDFKIALITFAEEAQNALSSVEMEIRQIRNWLLRDQLSYWQSQIKRYQEKVSTTRADLHRRQLMKTSSEAISDTEQKEALRDAQRKLREAEEKVIIIKKWIPVLEHALSEYHSQSQPLGDRLSGSFAATLSLLDRMLGALDAYLAMAPPTAPVAPRLRAVDREAETAISSTSTSTSAAAGQPTSPSEEATAEYAVPHAQDQRSREDADDDATAEYRTQSR